MANLYWTVYKRIEEEVLELSYNVVFDDNQVRVYSMKIAELILKCAIEVEAIAKDLYKNNGGNMQPVDENGDNRVLYFDTDCIQHLVDIWSISSKEIYLTCTEFSFVEKLQVLKPLHKANRRGSSGSLWKRAYMSIKHDRNNQLNKATIENLINILGALYVLNLYYQSDDIHLGGGVGLKELDATRGSKIFSASYIYSEVDFTNDSDFAVLPEDVEKYIYITRYPKSSYKKYITELYISYDKLRKNLNGKQAFLDYCESNSYTLDVHNLDILKGKFNGGLFKKDLIEDYYHDLSWKRSFNPRIAELYKNHVIYDEFDYVSYVTEVENGKS